MPRKLPADRTWDEIREHYEVERELAARLRMAPPVERMSLYSAVYDELFQRLPRHPQLTRKQDVGAQEKAVALHMIVLRRYLRADSTYLEIGPGDCSVALEAARCVRECVAVDVSTEITRKAEWPANFHLIISDGSSVPVPEGSVDIAYSNQLMEHLHPDDARQQLVNIQRALKPGGRYICRTPNRFSGPHDISRYFDEVATGFHLREYSLTELAKLFRDVGFARLGAFVVVRGRFVPHPLAPVLALEWILEHLPRRPRQRLAAIGLVQLALGINLVGEK